MVRTTASVKGQGIYVTRGTYLGKKGWIDIAAGKKPKKIDVILVGDDDGEFTACIFKTSICLDVEPASYEEAALQQHPMVKNKMDDLCKKMAQLDIQSLETMVGIFSATLESKIKEQNDLGEEADWKSVDFDK
jgi:hypothetical protein